MNYIRAALGGLRAQWKVHRVFIVFIIAVQLICTLIACFVSGLLINNQYIALEDSYSSLFFAYQFNNDSCPTVEASVPVLNKIYDCLKLREKEIEIVAITEDEDGNTIWISDWICWSKDGYSRGMTYDGIIADQVTIGRNIDDEDFSLKNHVALLAGPYEKESVEILGQSYKIVGWRHSDNLDKRDEALLSIPCCVWGDIPIKLVSVSLNSVLSKSQIEKIQSILADAYGENISVTGLDAEDMDYKRIYQTVAVLVAIISFADVGILFVLYSYLAEKNRKRLNIFRLCGASRMECVGIYMLENMIVCIGSVLSSLVMYAIIIEPVLTHFYTYFGDIYSLKLYGSCFLLMTLLTVFQSFISGLLQIRYSVDHNLRVYK